MFTEVQEFGHELRDAKVCTGTQINFAKRPVCFRTVFKVGVAVLESNLIVFAFPKMQKLLQRSAH